MAEDINQDEDDIEEEEEDRGAEAQQTLDDLTVLGDSSDHPDDPEEQGPGDDLSEWEEPSASQSLSVIHTGSRPTDAELLSNLIPEGEVIVEAGEIVRTDEEVGEPLDDVEPPAVELESPERDDPPAERDPEPAPAPQAEADEPAPPPAPDDEPVVEERDVDVQPAEPAAAAAPPPEVLPVDPPDEEEEEEEDDDDGDDDYPLETTDAEGGEDSAIALDIDPGDATEVTIANVPEGATLSAGTDNGDGTWTLTADQLDDLTITPPADSDVDFTLEVTAGDDTESLDVTVNAVADAPTATAEDVSGTEDNPIDLDLASVVTDVDLRDADGNPILDENGDIVRSESLSITIGGVPDGATLSAGTDNGDGTWTLTADDLTGLQINPPADFAGEIPLTLTSTSTEADGGDSATTEVPFTVTVADTVDVTAATTLEDTAVALDIDLPEGVGSVDIADIPDGAILMSGGQVIDVTNGSVTLTAEQLVDLTIQAPLDSDVDFTLQVTADVDKPTADGQDESGVAGSEIPLNLTAGLSDTDGSETLS
ncbi:MAG: Ig-like domain-containing protein, partial [Rhodospirillaceae bacterium]|nr:Ig-like domain-containing protein [Rhodospirillaceae bacterium]